MADCRIALIEDDPIMGGSLTERFSLEGWAACWMRSYEEALAHWDDILRADIVISDMRLTDGTGKELFDRYREDGGARPFILITAYATITDAVAMVRNGLHDYWSKPFDIEDAVKQLWTLLEAGDGGGGGDAVLGHCPAMREVQAMLSRLADNDASILLVGESGVGKEEAVRYLHGKSKRRDHPLVAINCGAIPADLLESELFGYERGAFTGAASRKIGLVEKAHGGLLFLDEIGDMPLFMQAKLLRALQERTITRLGGSAAIPVNFRLVCATHRNLKEMVQRGAFREDLFFRINVVQIRIPPLRERGADVLWLAHRLMQSIAGNGRQAVRGLLPEAEQALLEYDYPGNVRELRNMLERALALTDAPFLSRHDVMPSQVEGGASVEEAAPCLKDQVRKVEYAAILSALHASGENMSKTAAMLGISRKNLWEKMKKLGLKKD